MKAEIKKQMNLESNERFIVKYFTKFNENVVAKTTAVGERKMRKYEKIN